MQAPGGALKRSIHARPVFLRPGPRTGGEHGAVPRRPVRLPSGVRSADCSPRLGVRHKTVDPRASTGTEGGQCPRVWCATRVKSRNREADRTRLRLAPGSHDSE